MFYKIFVFELDQKRKHMKKELEFECARSSH